ncbi:Methylenetetrahydrofolate--tRNA-(uracil-5-)-methyltransferase [Frankliniella fusca]|uniref:Methylenetetrahydrofolate--tRNA-(Uracil-5-)-methyltransferase n=1 Tax=Frankliniella fusca TaxID=407009 RepID=A0AAE1LKK5_9NEOP|nr:Methylenetetrahydrofolate--tRNA-(uracil-5-)-methyltransferase [Frankliniella fusca]
MTEGPGPGPGWAAQAMLAPWRCLSLVGGALAVHQVRGWPGRPGPCTPRSAGHTYAGMLVALLFELVCVCIAFRSMIAATCMKVIVFQIAVFGLISTTSTNRIAVRLINVVLSLCRASWLIGAARRRRVRADVFECLRLYGARLPLGARGAAAALAVASVVPVHMLIYVCDIAVFTPVFAPAMGLANTITFSGMFLLQQLQWSVALVLMMYPMVVVGSLSADLRRDCNRTAALRLRQSTSSPDKEGLGPHVRAKWLRQTRVIRLAEILRFYITKRDNIVHSPQ